MFIRKVVKGGVSLNNEIIKSTGHIFKFCIVQIFRFFIKKGIVQERTVIRKFNLNPKDHLSGFHFFSSILQHFPAVLWSQITALRWCINCRRKTWLVFIHCSSCRKCRVQKAHALAIRILSALIIYVVIISNAVWAGMFPKIFYVQSRVQNSCLSCG